MSRVAFQKNISFSLNPEDIQKAINEVRAFQEELRQAVKGLCEELLEIGTSHAKVSVANLQAVDTGSLMASIGHGAYDPQTHTGIIYAGGYHAVFVEFGTGVIGEENPHPGLNDGTVADFAVLGSNGTMYTGYDTNGHGESGWWYKPDSGGRYRWTKGMPARPFMYNTFKYLEEIAGDKGAEIIGEFIF